MDVLSVVRSPNDVDGPASVNFEGSAEFFADIVSIGEYTVVSKKPGIAPGVNSRAALRPA